VIVFTALLSKYFLKKSLNLFQWTAILVITFGLSINAMNKSSSATHSGKKKMIYKK